MEAALKLILEELQNINSKTDTLSNSLSDLKEKTCLNKQEDS